MPLLKPVQEEENYCVELLGDHFRWLEVRKGRGIVDRKVLLLIDQLESSELLQDCRNLLSSLFPKKIYSLALIDSRN